jgi:hypothetical protein
MASIHRRGTPVEGGAAVEGGRKKRRQKGRLAMSLITPKLFSEATCNGYGDGVSLLREPDAANPHLRFDERGVET